ncbi:MAG: DUF4099 domain-containing protein [Prevotellaceae bacterium]|nr:DUF4099 domain-containing protein [Prevotellaceae bacterium]
MKQAFQEKDIPYEEFARLGYNKRDILFMNKEDLKQLLAGKRTSLMEINSVDGQKLGKSIEAKFSLQRDEDGKVKLIIHPVRNEIQNDIKLNATQLEKLKQGQIVMKKINDENYLIQLDKDNNELLKTKVKDIVIPSHIEHIELGQEQKQKLKKGEPIILVADNKEFQVSVDLNARLGYRFDSLQNLEREQQIKFDQEHPEYIGVMQTDENRDQYINYQKELQPKKEKEEEGYNNTIKFKP